MILHSLEMHNFRQYIGTQKIDFSVDPKKNVTVLIGVNTSGKTTIVRAFEWCLYGKNGFEDQILLNSEVKDKMREGEAQDVWVEVTFSHDGITYYLRRTQRYICADQYRDNGKIVVNLSKKSSEDLSLEYLRRDGQTKLPIERYNIDESINRILPKDLSDYFFFGGERISGIANRTDLSKAVRGLMRLDVLENAYTHLKTVIKGFEDQIDTDGDANAQRAKDSLATYKQKLGEVSKEVDTYARQRDYWLDKVRDYDAQLARSNIEEVKRIVEDRKKAEVALQREKEKLLRIQDGIVKDFNNRPYAFFGLPSIKESLEFLEKQNDKAGGVKESIPAMEQDAVDFLIKRGRCICGTKLDKNTLPYDMVMEVRKVLPPEHVGDAVRQYKNKSEGYLSGTEDYKQRIESKFKEYRECKRTIRSIEGELESLNNKSVDDTDAKAIEDKRRDAYIKYKDAAKDYDEANQKVGQYNTNISNCEKAIEKFAKSSSKNQKTVRLINYAQSVYDWLLSSYKEKEAKVREELQVRVNDNFAKMYHGERTIRIDDKYRVRYADVKTEESDGLKAVKSFAFIASLVSMAKDKILDDSEMKLGQVYPLVMDAPFSNVDEIHIDNICKILPKTANQVIMAVMQKDWEYASRNLEGYVGKSYVIEKDRDSRGKEIDTATHIR